jgi:hypothetical protein
MGARGVTLPATGEPGQDARQAATRWLCWLVPSLLEARFGLLPDGNGEALRDLRCGVLKPSDKSTFGPPFIPGGLGIPTLGGSRSNADAVDNQEELSVLPGRVGCGAGPCAG